jgi:hypothetical protein
MLNANHSSISPQASTRIPETTGGSVIKHGARSGQAFWPIFVGVAVATAVLTTIAVVLVIFLADEPPSEDQFPSGRREDSADKPPPAAPPAVTHDIATGVHRFCGKCHAYPPPDTFPRSAWREEVEQGFRFFAQSNLALQPPPIDEVIKYYEARAPEKLPPAAPETASEPPRTRFRRINYPVPANASPPAIANVNLVHLFDPKRLDILACDMRHGQVMVLRPYLARPTWQVLANVGHPAHAEVVDLNGDGIPDILVANLGSFEPTDLHKGSVIWLRGKSDGTFTPITLLDGVGRVADVQAHDFRRSGKKDLAVAVFGWRNTGEVLYLENHTTDWNKPRFVGRVLDDRHGAIHVPVGDIDGDGRPDIVALISQEHEEIVAFLNQGNGKFRKKIIYTAPHPAYGSSGIQLVDLNHDGRLDVLYTNGDVLDKPYILKPYHTIQWLENQGKFPFRHHSLTPLYGVHRAVAADFAGKGKKDIVAVSFLPEEGFPQRKALGLDAVIFLEQTPAGKFERHSLEKTTCDHVSCVAGDVFGTGRTDIVVGQYSSTPSALAVTVWKNEGPARGQ